MTKGKQKEGGEGEGGEGEGGGGEGGEGEGEDENASLTPHHDLVSYVPSKNSWG